MSARSGRSGLLKIGTQAVTELKSWSISESMDNLEATAMGDTHRRYVTGIQSWSGNLECNFDKDDAAGQGALRTGAELSATFYNEGDASGAHKFEGKILITGINMTTSFDAIVMLSVEFNGVGPLTEGTQ